MKKKLKIKLRRKFLIVKSKKYITVPNYFSFSIENFRNIEKAIINSARV
jgi:hypothetical protein